MNVIVRYAGAVIPLALKQADASVPQLQSQIRKEFGFAPSQQRIIFKGKVLSHKREKLQSYGILDGFKVLLLADETSAQPEELGPRRGRRPPRSERVGGILNARVVRGGPPAGSLKGMKGPNGVLPRDPFIVYNTNGTLVKLWIETDAFWADASSEESERLFYTDITALTCPDLAGYEDQYCAIVLETVVMRAFYFIPKQYTKLIEGIWRS
jgi:hypothetical protein